VTWGPSKALDGRTKTLQSLAIVMRSVNPWMQFDLGSIRTDISVVRIVGRADWYAEPPSFGSTSLTQQSNLSVWLSPTTAFTSGTLCVANLSPSVIGEALHVLCPVNISARYVTVQMNTTGKLSNGLAGVEYLSLQEVTPLYDGEQGTTTSQMHCMPTESGGRLVCVHRMCKCIHGLLGCNGRAPMQP
jgi:hypothetical protein